tara:strand:- start:863 stop:1240 length:378 start_codon:yes stop_codon:yes gene_type:complete
MKYKLGDIVRVAKRGIHFDEKAKVTEVNTMAIPNGYKVNFQAIKGGDFLKVDTPEVNTMAIPNNYYYTIELYSKGCKIVINENDIKPYELVKDSKPKTDCECGGDKLSIPHHYDWCPEFKKKIKN